MLRARVVVLLSLTLTVADVAHGQVSSGYRQLEQDLSSGGPSTGTSTLSSTSFQVTLEVAGTGRSGQLLSSPSHRVGDGLTWAAVPPSEVSELRCTLDGLRWDLAPYGDTYTLRRGLLSELADGYGDALAWDIVGSRSDDDTLPPPGDGFFYLIGATSRLGEEGPLGRDSRGVSR
ncbi:MAG: hypothetical protein AAF533_14465 [Acidobacteriota bacterium]